MARTSATASCTLRPIFAASAAAEVLSRAARRIRTRNVYVFELEIAREIEREAVCKVQLAHFPHKRTNTCSPCGQDWNQDLYFDLSENLNDHSINIQVCDEGSIDLLLDAKINIEQILKKNNLHGLYAIFDRNKIHAGRLRVLMVYPADENSPGLNKEIANTLASTN